LEEALEAAKAYLNLLPLQDLLIFDEPEVLDRRDIELSTIALTQQEESEEETIESHLRSCSGKSVTAWTFPMAIACPLL
jgi:hypothetical protein